MAGSALLERAETMWALIPGAPWLPGDYLLEADRRLEDLAGNNRDGPFECPPRTKRGDVAKVASQPFSIAPSEGTRSNS